MICGSPVRARRTRRMPRSASARWFGLAGGCLSGLVSGHERRRGRSTSRPIDVAADRRRGRSTVSRRLSLCKLCLSLATMCDCNGGIATTHLLCGTRTITQAPHACPVRGAAIRYVSLKIAPPQLLATDPSYRQHEHDRVRYATLYHQFEAEGNDDYMDHYAKLHGEAQTNSEARAAAIFEAEKRRLLLLAITQARAADQAGRHCTFVTFHPDYANPTSLTTTDPAPRSAQVNAACLQHFCANAACRYFASRPRHQ